MPTFLGVDGGGSSTRALALDESGITRFQGQAGAANLTSTPPDKLEASLSAALADAPAVDAVVGCFAGLLTPEDGRRAEALLERFFPGVRVRAYPDYVAALRAFEEAIDVCVIAGTGSLVCSSSAEGFVKSGGRGYLLGDEGSAFQVGREGLNLILDQRIEPASALARSVAEVFHTDEPAAIVAGLYRSQSPAALLAKLAPAVADDAAAGFEYAIDSVDRHMSALARIVRDHAARNAIEPHWRVGLAGGLWKAGRAFERAFAANLSKMTSDRPAILAHARRPPVYGAVALAKELFIGD